jgi:hypothetical protein
MDKVIPNVLHYEQATQKNQVQDFIEDCYQWLQAKYNIEY